MAELTLEVALKLAGSLVTIGHPYAQVAIEATALDLTRCCASREEAELLVETARSTWEGWPERGGTRMLKELCRTLFPPAAAKPLTYPDLVAQGILAPRCAVCPPDAAFCEYGGPRAHRRYLREAAEAKPTPIAPRKPVTSLTLDQLQERAQANYEDERRRKKAQLDDLNQERLG